MLWPGPLSQAMYFFIYFKAMDSCVWLTSVLNYCQHLFLKYVNIGLTPVSFHQIKTACRKVHTFLFMVTSKSSLMSVDFLTEGGLTKLTSLTWYLKGFFEIMKFRTFLEIKVKVKNSAARVTPIILMEQYGFICKYVSMHISNVNIIQIMYMYIKSLGLYINFKITQIHRVQNASRLQVFLDVSEKVKKLFLKTCQAMQASGGVL